MARVEGRTKDDARRNAVCAAPTYEDTEWVDAIPFGTLCDFGAIVTELEDSLDRRGPRWKRGALAGEIGRKRSRCFRG